MLNRLKQLKIDAVSLEEAVELSAFARMLRAEFEATSSDVPEWLDRVTRELRREIHARQADSVDKRLSELKARQLALMPAEERRKKVADEIAALESRKQLAVGGTV